MARKFSDPDAGALTTPGPCWLQPTSTSLILFDWGTVERGCALQSATEPGQGEQR